MKPIFRSSMFGFNKEDVAGFISKQSKQYEKRIAELESEKEVLRSEFEAEAEVLRAEAESCSEALRLMEEKKKVIAEIFSVKTAIEKERDALLASMAEQALLTEKIGDDVSGLLEQLKSAEKMCEKANKFDRLAGALSEIVAGVSANPADSETKEIAFDYRTTSHVELSKNLQLNEEALKRLTHSLEALESLLLAFGCEE